MVPPYSMRIELAENQNLPDPGIEPLYATGDNVPLVHTSSDCAVHVPSRNAVALLAIMTLRAVLFVPFAVSVPLVMPMSVEEVIFPRRFAVPLETFTEP